ncbi:MAG TPA: lactate utilization protein C [Candidatus Pseudogracilibacillus intestinigallinarum]|uniref:Lactate utilization protein C n=1 Tax=Candidatus Pseudogracilibacillus intestinigallinarum TaxID=2838742 RepID=A0A9D1TJU5_9BACI|nr:lactate utilization protein C [Candidatus Pseudogracilibacillus intestinigallinarum]
MNKGTIQHRTKFLEKIAGKMHRKPRDMANPIERPKRLFTPEKDVLAHIAGVDLLPVFYRECEKILTDVVETTAASLDNVLRNLVKAHGNGEVVISKDARFTAFGLKDFSEEDFVYRWDPAKGEENVIVTERAQTGIMFSDITLAESATMVMFNDKDKGRAIGLLPETFIGIIPLSTLVPRMTQAAEEINRRIEAGETIASCVNFVSGPSNSADIEYNLVVGVHGPVKVSYIIVTDR